MKICRNSSLKFCIEQVERMIYLVRYRKTLSRKAGRCLRACQTLQAQELWKGAVMERPTGDALSEMSLLRGDRLQSVGRLDSTFHPRLDDPLKPQKGGHYGTKDGLLFGRVYGFAICN